ncbi:N-acetylmuramoyl-L-alanine amidase [Frankia sp. QA3]|uniref:N-acetylmuramoyl-L-alanine amidase n=1 Tax=Frankia sp. QA3 TaxID=710111 RepID=UPI000269B72B|nr:N-acetylmuramoyl-L-alanine amidase [Frankia sp. QA3]EIV90672.1 N-acetylmuramoyl-L-alanine amidase [Frankia sp. QA3]
MPAADPPRRFLYPAPLSRRRVLGLAGAGVGGWAAMGFAAQPVAASSVGGLAAAPAAGPMGPAHTRVVFIPRTLSATSRGTGPATAAFRIGYVAVRWSGPGGGSGSGLAVGPDSGGAAIRLRRANGEYGAWSPLAVGCPAERDDRTSGAPSAHAVLMGARTATGYELRVPPGASGVAVTALNTTSGPRRRLTVPAVTAQAALAAMAGLSAAAAAPRSPARARAVPRSRRASLAAAAAESAPAAGPLPAAQTVPAPASTTPTTPTGSAPSALGLLYLPRAAWGADESLRLDPATGQPWRTTYHPGQVITVHHTVTPNDDPDPAATVRAIYHFHTVERGWADIGYHFLIDEAGTLYEGRWSGTDSVPGHRPDGQVVTGAHVGGFNAGNVGVALLGDHRTRAPTAAARRSLVLVLQALSGAHRLNPVGSIDYVNPVSGAQRRVSAISGHRDWMATECPGAALYTALDTVRLEVAQALL